MDSRELIDAQFDRAVEIVQGLPKNGPIQTGYEEKLTMYRCAHDVAFLHSIHVFSFFAVSINKVLLLFWTCSCGRHFPDSYDRTAATVGNVQGSRPNVWDMLGRAKWCVAKVLLQGYVTNRSRDAWAKHKDLDSYEAKWLYVDALLKVC